MAITIQTPMQISIIAMIGHHDMRWMIAQ
jgi:hypothetical protein